MLIGAASICAQNIYKLSIDELLERGMQYSIAIQSSTLNTIITENKTSLAKNKQLPAISIGGSFGYVGTPTVLDKDLSFVKHSNTPDWKHSYQVSIVQPLYEGGRIKNNIDKAKLEEELASYALQKNKAELKIWLISKYLDLFNLYKRLEVYSKNIEETKLRLQDIQNMSEQGMTTSNDVLRSQIEVTNSELAYEETQNNIAVTSQELAIIVGLDETNIIQPDTFLLALDYPVKSETEYISDAYTQYPDLKMANTNLSLAKNNMELIKANYLPSLSLQISNTLNRPIPYSSPSQDLFINSWGIALNLSYNISNWFDKKQNTNIARNQISLQKLATEQQKQNIRTSIKSAWLKHHEAENRVKALNTSLEQATENYRIVKDLYFNQLAILTDLLDANAVFLNAELQLTNAQTNAIYMYYLLQKTSGNL